MSSEEPIYLTVPGEYITDYYRQQAVTLGIMTGRPVIVNVAAKPRWWQFWKRKKNHEQP